MAARWEWQNATGSGPWVPFSPAISSQIEAASARGERSVDVDAEHPGCIVDPAEHRRVMKSWETSQVTAHVRRVDTGGLELHAGPASFLLHAAAAGNRAPNLAAGQQLASGYLQEASPPPYQAQAPGGGAGQMQMPEGSPPPSYWARAGSPPPYPPQVPGGGAEQLRMPAGSPPPYLARVGSPPPYPPQAPNAEAHHAMRTGQVGDDQVWQQFDHLLSLIPALMAVGDPIDPVVSEVRTVAGQLGIEIDLNFGTTDSAEVYERCKQLRTMHCARRAETPAPAEPQEAACSICISEYPVSMMFHWGCASEHKLCIGEGTDNCAIRHVTDAIQSRAVPSCPECAMENPQGDHTMERTKLRNLVGPQSELWTKFKEIELQGFIDRGIGADADVGAVLVPCPGTDCNNFLLNENPGVKVEVRCDQEGGCGASFCSLCKDIYHHGDTTCEQAQQIRANWLDWIADGRQRFMLQLGHAAAQVNATAQAEAATLLQNLQLDEEWKAQNCRICPSCRRIVNKLEGCDTMVCGEDGHGGNVQNGCGASFKWSQAEQYRPAVAVPAAPADVMSADDLLRGEHEGISCMICRVMPIVGPRFECLHCPTTTEGRYNVCFKCERQLHEPDGHPDNHAFDRINPPGGIEPEPDGADGEDIVYIWDYRPEVELDAAAGGGAAETPCWEWQGDDEVWTPYEPATCQTLEAAYEDASGSRVTGAPVEIGGERWVNLKKMRQCRWDNEERLTVRRVEPVRDAPAEHDWVGYSHDQCVALTEAYLQQIQPPLVVLADGVRIDFSQMSHTAPDDDRRYQVRGRMSEQAPMVPALGPR